MIQNAPELAKIAFERSNARHVNVDGLELRIGSILRKARRSGKSSLCTATEALTRAWRP